MTMVSGLCLQQAQVRYHDSKTTVEISRWKVNFSYAKNRGDESTLPVVAFRFFQSNFFKILFAQSLDSSMCPPNSFSRFESFAFTTPFPMLISWRLFMTPPAIRVPIAMSLTFLRRWSSSVLGLPARLNATFCPRLPS